MDALVLVAVVTSAVGAGAVGGVFLAFSGFIMRTLAELPPRQGLMTMQSINRTVLCLAFLGPFLGTAVVSLGLLVLVLRDPGEESILAGAGAGLYLVGTFLVTARGNVPLNEALARIDSDAADVEDFWQDYQRRWTRLNHLRTAAALAACALLCASRFTPAG